MENGLLLKFRSQLDSSLQAGVTLHLEITPSRVLARLVTLRLVLVRVVMVLQVFMKSRPKSDTLDQLMDFSSSSS